MRWKKAEKEHTLIHMSHTRTRIFRISSVSFKKYILKSILSRDFMLLSKANICKTYAASLASARVADKMCRKRPGVGGERAGE